MKPNNIEDIKQGLTRSQLPLPLNQEFKAFVQVCSDETTKPTQPLIFHSGQGKASEGTTVMALSLRFLESLTDGSTANLIPDICWGAESDDLYGRVLKQRKAAFRLKHSSSRRICSWSGLQLVGMLRNSVGERGMAGALGARGMINLQCYGESEYNCDGNAYTSSATFQDEILKIMPFGRREHLLHKTAVIQLEWSFAPHW
jgi:hypothetical protein